MSRDRLVPGVATIVLLLCLTGVIANGQKKQNQSADEKPRKVKSESDRALREWPKEVDSIITQSERDAFQKLRTNEEREHFIEIFWDLRDTDPDTQENEYKDEYYQRMAYANEHFSSGKV